MFLKRLRIWWIDHKIVFLSILFFIVLFAASVFGLLFVDSYMRSILVATFPFEMFKYGLFSVISAFFFVMLVYRNGMGFGGSKGNVIAPSSLKIGFKDVIGLTEAKREAKEVVSLLKDRAKIRRIGGKVIRGLLMVGPPGCGKTYLAKAIAKEADVPFISISGSEFVEVFVGVGASRVRQLFQKARALAYIHGSAIIFVDELDAIGRQRHLSAFGNQETDNTLNQLLVNMDGLANDIGGQVIVIGATNADQSVLDPALLRPGRFDRHIEITRPHLKDREELFAYYLKKVKVDSDINIGRLARKAVWRTPAEIENVVKEAALIAFRNERESINMRDISGAFERIDLGLETHLDLTPEEQERVAYHEAGHLLVLYYQHPTNDVFKASIKTRGGALGVVYHHPREELYMRTKDELLADVKTSLAGHIAEKIKYTVTSTGACSDFVNATRIASSMVWGFGMSGAGLVGDYNVLLTPGRMSEGLKDRLNVEMEKILGQAAVDVEEFLKKEWSMMEVFAKALVERKELDYDEVEEIFKAHGKERVARA
jgi:cell division protease FtsH